MKQLILAAALLFTSVSQAEVLAFAGNNAGGRINLTTERGKCPTDQLVAFSTSKEGAVNRGCWWFESDHVWVRYENGNTRAYDPTLFSLKEKQQSNKKAM